MTVAEYMSLLASNAPAPGGGSASALSGAQGMGLITMVAGLTLGKKKYLDYTENCESVIADGMKIQSELIAQIDRDTEAFNLVSAAFRMPKDTEDEKTVRRKAIADATLAATKAPFYTIELSLEALRVGERMLGKLNTNCVSDLGVAALNLRSCAYGAWLNVLINIGGLDESSAADFKTRGLAILAEVDALYAKLYTATTDML